MPRRRVHGKRRSGELTHEEEWSLLLHSRTRDDCNICAIAVTCTYQCWVFRSNKERRRYWQEHRDKLLQVVNQGTRPQAWWDYEAPGPKLPDEGEWEALARLGCLTPEETDYFESRGLLPLKRQPTGADPREILRDA